MSKAKHTPGPWVIHKTAIVSADLNIADGTTKPYEICIPQGRSLDECIANARLIAAAPTMYEELQRAAIELAGWLEDESIPSRTWEAISKRLVAVNAALAKGTEP